MVKYNNIVIRSDFEHDISTGETAENAPLDSNNMIQGSAFAPTKDYVLLTVLNFKIVYILDL